MGAILQALQPTSIINSKGAASPQQMQQGVRQAIPGAGQPPNPAPQGPNLMSFLQSLVPQAKPQVDTSPEALAKQFELLRKR